ncbi:MAG: GNAT family N-acetyltransferase [Rhodobacteraceae bacterium]|nr:MAG: GNAT family N-acetyltransferase [Paracoccaceae bacterium]
MEVWLGTYMREGVNAFFADYVLREFTTAKFEVILKDPAESIWVSQNTTGIDGFVRVTRGKVAPVSGCSDVELTTLYVQGRHRGKGIGLALLKRALTLGDPWLTTNTENEGAIAFYLAHGFAIVGKTHFKIQDQAYLNHVIAFQG